MLTLGECITYLQNVSSERKPRSRKARQIIKYLEELKKRKESDKRICDKLKKEMFDYNKGFLISDYNAGYDDGIKKAINILKGETHWEELEREENEIGK